MVSLEDFYSMREKLERETSFISDMLENLYSYNRRIIVKNNELLLTDKDSLEDLKACLTSILDRSKQHLELVCAQIDIYERRFNDESTG